ncbi:MAG: TetR/AcrR family transcriptional regulator [Chloroflexota bacterium]
MVQKHEPEQPRRRSDGEQTHATILGQAVRLASIEGVNQITIGRLAEKTGVSKSGVYAHFGSKERLQMEVIRAADEIYAREVIQPGLEAPEGLPRLMNLYEAYVSYIERDVFPGGCFFAGLIAEFDAQSGPIHEAVVAGRRQWDELVEGLIRVAQQGGDLDPSVNPKDLAFELDAIIDHTNMMYTLFRDPVSIQRGRAILADIFKRIATPGCC